MSLSMYLLECSIDTFILETPAFLSSTWQILSKLWATAGCDERDENKLNRSEQE